MVLLGIVLRKVKLINEEFQKKLSQLLLNAILPISILSSSSNEFSKELSKGLITTAIVCFIYYTISLIILNIICKRFKTDDATKKIFITMSAFANVGFIGFPVVEELIGSNGMLYAVIYNMFYQLFFFTYGINILSGKKTFKIDSIIKSPVIISSIVSIMIYLSPYRFPKFFSETLLSVGNMMVPLSMIIIGCTLYDIDFKEILKDKYSYIVSLLRLIIFPFLLIGGLLILNITGETAIVLVILTALPCGSLNVILAENYNCNPKFATRTVVQSMIFMMISIPCIIFLSLKLFG